MNGVVGAKTITMRYMRPLEPWVSVRVGARRANPGGGRGEWASMFVLVGQADAAGRATLAGALVRIPSSPPARDWTFYPAGRRGRRSPARRRPTVL